MQLLVSSSNSKSSEGFTSRQTVEMLQPGEYVLASDGEADPLCPSGAVRFVGLLQVLRVGCTGFRCPVSPWRARIPHAADTTSRPETPHPSMARLAVGEIGGNLSQRPRQVSSQVPERWYINVITQKHH